MHGPNSGDVQVAPRIFMDSFCARFAEEATILWHPGRGKLWIDHPVLNR